MNCRCSSSSALVKREFFKKWIKGLQIYSRFNKEMSILERKKAIKFSADVAIASTRNAATHWSKALVADVETSADGAARTVLEQMLGRKLVEKKALLITCSNKIVRRSRRVVRSRKTSIAEKLVRNRTRVLKRLVPGGQQLDEISLIKETLDYIASLQVQVDVMRHLAAAAAAQRIHHQDQQRSF